MAKSSDDGISTLLAPQVLAFTRQKIKSETVGGET